jgi:hypothetical protein
MPSAVNRLHTASENLWISLAAAFDTDKVVRLKRHALDLLHKDETTLGTSDPNHPYRLYGASGDTIGNRSRFRSALREFVDGDEDSDDSDAEDNSDLSEVVDAMFNSSSTHYSKMTELLSKYRDYVVSEAGVDSDTDSD